MAQTAAASQIDDLSNAAQTAARMNPMAAAFGPQAMRCWEAHQSILADFETLAASWLKRRHAAADSAQAALREIGRDGDPARIDEAMSVMNDWLSKEMTRLSQDATDNLDFGMKTFVHLTEGVAGVEAEAVESVREAAERSAEAAGGESRPD